MQLPRCKVCRGAAVFEGRTGACLANIGSRLRCTAWPAEQEEMSGGSSIYGVAWDGPRSSQLHVRAVTDERSSPDSMRLLISVVQF